MYFTPEDLPPRLDWVERNFPFPLAFTFARLRTAFDRHPLEAVWAVRDAWEVAIKFCACVSVADFLHADPDKATAERVAAGLLSDRGVAIGKWVEVLVATIEDISSAARKLPQLRTVFREGEGSNTTPQFDAVLGFAGWRNDVFGHGVFTHDLPWYAGQATACMKMLIALYAALRPVFDGWTLVGRTTDGQAVDWSGCDFQPKRDRHQHDPVGSALPLFLTRDGVELSFGPLLSVQRCKECDHPAAFFFDRQRTADDTVLLEYVAGVKGKKKQWDEVAKLSDWLPTDFKWERRLYDTGELLDGIPIVFRDFDREYVRPAYLLDAIRQLQKSAKRGYILLDGPEGTGKSYLSRGLAEKEAGGLKVLAYYVRPGDLSHFASFLIELNRQVHDKLLPANKRTFEPQAKGAKTPAELQAEFVDYFTTVLAGRAGAVLVIDALDELPDADPTTPLITDLLPDPAKLPPNLHIVLTARAGELKPRAAARWQALAADSLRLTLDPTSEANRGLVGEYLKRENVAAADDILARSGGVFLYAWHFVAALRQGVFTGTADLPPAVQFYPAFLDRIRQRVGDTLFDTIYRKLLLLLTAAKVPVTKEQIERWGIPADRLTTALGELRDFVRQIRHRDWHEGMGDHTEQRYKIAHEMFVRYVEMHKAEWLRDAHRTIATAALRHCDTRWEGLDPADDADLYDVRFVLHHCKAANLKMAHELRSDDLLALVVSRFAVIAAEAGRWELAAELYEQSEAHYRGLVCEFDRSDLVKELAHSITLKVQAKSANRNIQNTLESKEEVVKLFRYLVEKQGKLEHATNLANALSDLGNSAWLTRKAESLEYHDEAISILRTVFSSRQSPEALTDVAMALSQKGLTLNWLNDSNGSLGCHTEAIAILYSLVENWGRHELSAKLAHTLLLKGEVWNKLGNRKEELKCAESAVFILRDAIERRGLANLTEFLANALVKKGKVLASTDENKADACFLDAIDIWRNLVKRDLRLDLIPDFANGISLRGHLLTKHGQTQTAFKQYDQASSLYQDLINIHGRTSYVVDLVGAVESKWQCLLKSNRVLEWVPSIIDSIRLTTNLLLRQLLEKHIVTSIVRLADGLSSLAESIVKCDGHSQAIEIYTYAIRAYTYANSQCKDCTVDMKCAFAMMKRGNALLVLNREEWTLEFKTSLNQALETFLSDRSEGYYYSSLESLKRLAHEVSSIGMSLAESRRIQDAIVCCDIAVEVFVELYHRANLLECSALAAKVLVSIADHIRLSKGGSDALPFYIRALEILKRTVDLPLTDVSSAKLAVFSLLNVEISRVCLRLGDVLETLGRWENAVQYLSIAISSCQTRISKYGCDEEVVDLAGIMRQTGTILYANREWHRAQPYFAEAVRYYQQAVADQLQNEYRIDLMHAHVDCANCCMLLNLECTDFNAVHSQLYEALKHYDTVFEIYSTLTIKQPLELRSDTMSLVVHLTAELRERLFAVASPGLAEFLRINIFTTPPPV